MIDDYIPITWLNDYIFCPYSIYLHNVYANVDEKNYHEVVQTVGKANHSSVDKQNYSTKKSDIIGIDVYCEKYGLSGKIDIFHQDKMLLVERKTLVKTIYDGYRYQLYAQYFGLIEGGYTVEKLCIHSLKDNKRYEIEIPNGEWLEKFEKVVENVRNYSPDVLEIIPNINKCRFCIYRNLCDKTEYRE